MADCELEVEYNGFKGNLPVVVISGEDLCLLGRNWLQHISLDWSAIFNLTNFGSTFNCFPRGSGESRRSQGQNLHLFFREATTF